MIDQASLQTLLKEVCHLQKKWDSKTTPSMIRRGKIIRHQLPELLRKENYSEAFDSLMGDKVAIEGSDGMGLKARIPWIRIFSKLHSPKATDGWYCTYLFHAEGDGVYLSLQHGATEFRNGEFIARPKEKLQQLVWSGRSVLHNELTEDQ